MAWLGKESGCQTILVLKMRAFFELLDSALIGLRFKQRKANKNPGRNYRKTCILIADGDSWIYLAVEDS